MKLRLKAKISGISGTKFRSQCNRAARPALTAIPQPVDHLRLSGRQDSQICLLIGAEQQGSTAPEGVRAVKGVVLTEQQGQGGMGGLVLVAMTMATPPSIKLTVPNRQLPSHPG